jgi:hypothetical protein
MCMFSSHFVWCDEHKSTLATWRLIILQEYSTQVSTNKDWIYLFFSIFKSNISTLPEFVLPRSPASPKHEVSNYLGKFKGGIHVVGRCTLRIGRDVRLVFYWRFENREEWLKNYGEGKKTHENPSMENEYPVQRPLFTKRLLWNINIIRLSALSSQNVN